MDDAKKLVQNKPGAYGIERIYYNCGTELASSNDRAIAYFTAAIAAHPVDFIYGNRATPIIYGKYREALHDDNRAIALNDNPNPITTRPDLPRPRRLRCGHKKILVKAVRLGYVSRICRAILNHPKFILMRCNPVRQRRDTVFYISPLAAYFLQINENSITQNPIIRKSG